MSNPVYFHLFPSISLPGNNEKLGSVIIKSKSLIDQESSKHREFLDYLSSLFVDPFGNSLEEGVYIIDEAPGVVKDIWLLLRYAAFIPRESDDVFPGRHNQDLTDWYMFYAVWEQEQENEILKLFSASKNGIEFWDSFDSNFYTTLQQFYSSNNYLSIKEEGMSIANKLMRVFDYPNEYNVETELLAKRLRKAVYWYNASFDIKISKFGGRGSLWNYEQQLLNLAIAFETLFQPPSSDIRKYLETVLGVLFPDNEFVSKWLHQFYEARSAIVHGSSLSNEELRFKPDKGIHNNLIYWARKIFRACIDANISQWEASQKSGLRKHMTPNRIRLKRIMGKLANIETDKDLDQLPEDISVDIRDLHANWLDSPDETCLVFTYNIGKSLCHIAINSPLSPDKGVRCLCKLLLSLQDDWYKEASNRSEAIEIYKDILEVYGDESHSIDTLIDIECQSDFDETFYHWAKFAYAHLWFIDIA